MSPAALTSSLGAVLSALAGFALLSLVALRLTQDYRQRRELLAGFPELEEFEDDLRRYLQRVYLLQADHARRVDPATKAATEALFERTLSVAREVRAIRHEKGDASEGTATLLELEDELEVLLIRVD